MAKDKDKTNVMRVLDSKKIAYSSYSYTPDSSLTGEEIAKLLNEDVERVFKTLVTQAKSGSYYVFVVPVNATLHLKKAASAVGEKSIAMLPQKELLPLTGYIHGGCSPVGMKKLFPTFIHETAQLFDTIFVSAGRRGCQIELSPDTLCELIGAKYVDLTEE